MTFYEQLDALYKEGNHEKIETFLLDALRDFTLTHNDAMVIATFNELGAFFRGISQYERAERYFEESLALLAKMGMQVSKQFAGVLLNYAGCFRFAGQLEKAEEQFLKAKFLFEQLDAQQDYEYVSLLNNLALVYMDQGKISQALEMADQALAIVREMDDAEHEIATSLNNVAAMYLNLQQYDKAEALLREALAVYDAMPEANVHHAAALNSLAFLYVRQGKYPQALDLLQRAAEKNHFFFGENCDQARIYSGIASVQQMLGDKSAAALYQQKAASIFSRQLGINHPTTLQAQQRLAEYQA